MKIKLPRKIFLFVVFALLLISVLILLVFDGFLSRNKYSFDNYNDLVNICLLEKDRFNVDIKCEALIKSVDYKDDGSICFNVSILTQDKKLKNTQICENPDRISWDQSVMISSQQVPVDIELEFRSWNLLTYHLKSISMQLIPDTRVFSILEDFYSSSSPLSNVRTQESADIESNKYYVIPLQIKEGNSDIGLVYFTEVSIENVSIKGDFISMDMKIKIQKGLYDFTYESKKFAYISKSGEIIYIDTDNALEYIKSGVVQMTFAYAIKENDLTSTDLNVYCSKGVKSVPAEIFCNLDSYASLPKIASDDVNKYLEEIKTGEVLDLNDLTLNFVYGG